MSVSSSASTTARPSSMVPGVLTLDHPAAQDARLCGVKAANLAVARARGLDVLPGFVLTTAATADGRVAAGTSGPLHAAWRELGGDDDVTLVVRSSSTAEDTASSSMAGQFTSVLGVRGFGAFLSAIDEVLASGQRGDGTRPMAVLVQPQLDTRCAGVLFGLDPVDGDRRHLVVEAVEGTPDALVGGRVIAVHCVLSPRGRLVAGGSPRQRQLLPRRHRRRLAALARDAAAAFGGPQDVEWAVGDDDRLWLLQSRPVTAVGEQAVTHGPMFGTGPVAETFPEPLRPLEVSLWVDPLRAGIVAALAVTGAVGRRRLHDAAVTTVVGGRVAVDLELLGIAPRSRSGWQLLNPLPSARRLVAAWRVGRLRAALPALIADLLEDVDDDLTSLGPIDELDVDALMDLLDRIREELVALHGHEILAGMLLHHDGSPSLPSVALAALAEARADGLTDEDIVAVSPVTLALIPPAITGDGGLPAVAPAGRRHGADVGALGPRDALRLRCRWAQELGARVARRLGARLELDGVLDEAEAVSALSFDELRAAVLRRRAPERHGTAPTWVPGPPLPVVFRLTPTGSPVAVRPSGPAGRAGLPTSAGRAAGVVCHDPAELVDGQSCVLVTETLDPRLAPSLPAVVALVSETGSALSHLAILAREMKVPTVVAVPDACARFPVGSQVLVDGGTGEVSLLSPLEDPPCSDH